MAVLTHVAHEAGSGGGGLERVLAVPVASDEFVRELHDLPASQFLLQVSATDDVTIETQRGFTSTD